VNRSAIGARMGSAPAEHAEREKEKKA
jgi:hypothetical protein